MNYLVAVERTHDNPLTGSAQYRVVLSGKLNVNYLPKRRIWAFGTGFDLVTDRPYRTGTYINLRRALGV